MAAQQRLKGQFGLDAANQTLVNMADPVNPQDAATRGWTLTQLSGFVGGMSYQGLWNASTNSPALASGTGTKGFFYKVGTAGTTSLDGITNWIVGDMAMFDGTTWDKFDGNPSEVVTVAGRTGTVTLAQADIAGLTTASSPTFAAVTATTFSGNLTGNVTGNVSGSAGSVTGTVAIANGGTGQTTAAAAATALGLGASSAVTHASVSAATFASTVATGTAPFTVTSTTPVSNLSIGGNAATATTATTATTAGNVTGTVAIANGGTGQTTAAAALTALGGVATTLLGANSGVATLDGSGKLNVSQLPASVVGALNYQGTWNATTNTPTLTSGTGTKGYYYKVATAGTTTVDTISSWNVGDMIVFDGTTWDKIDGIATEVTSVAGRVGAVVLAQADISGLTTASSPTFASVSAATFSSTVATGTAPFTVTSTTPVSNLSIGGNAATATAATSATTAGNVSGVVAIANGGTGQSTAAAALTALGGVNSTQAAAAAPVQTVAGRTGTVVLAQADISGLTAASSPTFAGVTSGTLILAKAMLTSVTLTTSSTTSNQVVDSFAAATYRTVEWKIQITSSGSYSTVTVVVAQDGTNCYITQYGEVDTGSQLATFDSNITSGNVQLLATPVNATTTFNVLRIATNV